MGAIRPARPVKLICGLISNDPDLMVRAARLLSEHAGPIERTSPLWPFDSTEYYELEMGEHLQRQFVSFIQVIDPAELVHMKLLTNQLESRICYECAVDPAHRRVNMDPGYLSLSKLVLATTKDYSHRVYLRDGIYAESTLHYEAGQWLAWPWTYPDYAEARYHAFFEQVREDLKTELAHRSASSADRGGRA